MHGDGKDDHINFCPLYVKQSGLDDAVSVAAHYPSSRDIIDKYLNRGMKEISICCGPGS